MSSTIEISTEGLELGAKLDLWNESVWRNIGGLRSECIGEDNFNGRMTTTKAGHLTFCRLDATSHRVVRTPELIRQSDQGFLKVVAQLHGRACFQQAEREVWLSPGEWSVYDTTRAYAVTNPVSVEQLVILIPKDRLPEVLPRQSLLVQRVSGRNGLGRLAWDTMLSLYQELPSMGEHAAGRMADILTELVHMSLVETQGNPSQLSQREALRDRIIGYIARNLGDPRLNVDEISRALNCSRRQLYNAFSQEEDGLAEYIFKQRAILAKTLLEDPRNATRSLTDVAYDCGLVRPSQLTNLFRSRFGMSPSEFRAQQSVALLASM